MSEQAEELEGVEDEDVIEVEELEEIDLSFISYEDKDLEEWEEALSVKLPSLPTTTQIMTQCLIDLSNKYQMAYNVYSKLSVIASRAENIFKAEKYRLCNVFITNARAKGVKTLPAMDKIEMLIFNDKLNERLRMMQQRHKAYNDLKGFFFDNKNKLEKVMALAKDISYSVNASDKIYQNAQYHNGIQDQR